MGIKKWVNKQLAAFFLALSNVEKNALSQDGGNLEDQTKMVQRHQQGSIWDNLIQGEVTEEVKLLRARLYKVIQATNKIVVKMSYDDKGNAIYTIDQKDHKDALKRVKVDSYDDYPVELVFYNDYEVLGLLEVKSIHEKRKPLKVLRNGFTPRYLIENYTTKLVVRKINEVEKLLEFYIPIVPEEFNTNAKWFKTYFQKIKDRPNDDFFNMLSVELLTKNKDIGIDENYLFEFDEIKYDKVIEFDGYYVIKFKSKLHNLEDKNNYFVHEELDKLYEEKAPRKRK